MRTLMAGVLVAALGVAAPAWGQQTDIETEPRQVPRVVPPGLHYEQSRPSDSDYYPLEGPVVEHDPAFIEPFTTETETGKAGLAGWVAPTTPVGFQGERQNPGYVAIGLSVTWGGPPVAPRSPR
ncbi:MAG: hypothetical protein ACREJG_13795 [Candidatus Rokuibacteriota bacterium]